MGTVCKDCKSRNSVCHAACELYKMERERCELENAMIRKQKRLNWDLNGLDIRRNKRRYCGHGV